MATLEFIRYTPHRFEVIDGIVHWTRSTDAPINRLPQLVWRSNARWAEPNVWALEMARLRDIKSVQSSMYHLLSYANWLELEGIDWCHFPPRQSERCLTRFRGALVQSRNAGIIAPATASGRMSAVIRFYRWAYANKLLSPDWPMWSDRLVGMSLTNRFGFEHTLKVVSTDLAIRNSRIAGGPELEDGIMPLTASGMRDVLLLSESDASDELHLMLQLGFGTGLRLGSIVDLKVATLEAAVIDPLIGWTRIAVGPDATPPVATKFGNSGLVPIPQFLLDRLKDYALSTRRLKRQALAAKEHRDLLFISRFGNPYGGEGSRAVNVEVMRLRKVARSKGIDVLRGFHFHRTRATFATMLMRTALVHLPVPDAVNLVREACLHRDESTTLKYVKFIESSKAISDAANSFTEAFMGYAKGASDA